jgi:glyoxylase-like metal-dependent hydrolase (beta-lactamase superfamily II)
MTENEILTPAPPQVEEVSAGIFAYIQPDGTWFLNNAGFIVGPEGVIAIDSTSTARRARALFAALRRQTEKPVQVLVNTHSHGDHTWGTSSSPRTRPSSPTSAAARRPSAAAPRQPRSSPTSTGARYGLRRRSSPSTSV